MASVESWYLYLLPLLLPLLWLGVTALLATASGWRSLASRFRELRPTEGQVFRFVSGSIGARIFSVNYSNSLVVTVARAGIGLKPLVLFRLFSAPLFIPWTAMSDVQQDRALGVFPRIQFKVRDCWPGISLYGKVVEKIVSARAADGP